MGSSYQTKTLVYDTFPRPLPPITPLCGAKGGFFMLDTKKLVTVGLLIAIDVVLTRFFSFQTPVVRLTFNFIAIAVTGALYGPLTAGIAAAIADIIGMLLFPYGTFFPGFTLSAFLRGVTYGAIFHNRKIDIKSIILASAIVAFVIGLGVTSLWLNMTTGTPYIKLVQVRAIPNLITFAAQVLILTVVLDRIVKTGKSILKSY